jgi:hypothetical protein
MTPVLLTALLLAGPGDALAMLRSDESAVRLEGAKAWAKLGRRQALPPSWGDGASADPACVALRAPEELGCAKVAWACPSEEGFGSCTGGFAQTTWVALVAGDSQGAAPTLEQREPDLAGQQRAPGVFVLSHRSGEESLGAECTHGGVTVVDQRGMPLAPGHPEVIAARQRLEREQAACREQARRRAKREQASVRCELVLVEPCRREAYLRCEGRNLGRAESLGDSPPLGTVFRRAW